MALEVEETMSRVTFKEESAAQLIVQGLARKLEQLRKSQVRGRSLGKRWEGDQGWQLGADLILF